MAQRIGLRVSASGGRNVLGLPVENGAVSGTCISLQNAEFEQTNLSEADILDVGGGEVGFYWIFTRYGATKTIETGDQWTVWFSPPEGTFIYVDVSIDLVNSLGDGTPAIATFQLLRDDDGVVSTIVDETIPFGEVAFGNIGAIGSFAIDETFGPPAGYQNFWTGFEKTRENQP